MNRLFVLLFLGLLVIANSEKLRTLSLKKGVAQFPRNLEVQDTTTITNVSNTGYYPFNVAATFGSDYTTARDVDASTTYPMAIMISSNETVFGGGGSYFNEYYCYNDDLCTVDDNENDTITIELPFGTAKKVSKVYLNYTNMTQTTTPVAIVNGSWQLSSTCTPLKMDNFVHISGNDDLDFENSYPGYTSSYGWIGLGTEGNASANFNATTTPQFSFHLNASDKAGDLIFGMDSTRLAAWTPAVTLKTDENWRLNVTSISYGAYNYTSNGTAMTLVFDVLVEQLHLPPTVNAQLRDIWNTDLTGVDNCNSDNYLDYQCSYYSNNLTNVSNITFTLADGSTFSIDPYHFWSNSYNDQVNPDPDIERTWQSEIASVSTLYLNTSEYIVLGYRPLSNFYAFFNKDTTSGNTVTLYPPAPHYDGYNYTTPDKPVDNGGGNGGTGNNGTDIGSGDGGSTGSGDDSGDDAWITYLTYAGVAAVVIIFIVVVACCCCKSEPKPTAKKTLTVELRGADKSTESSVASSVRL